ncbi:MAG: hypothetical protein WCH01_17570 [Methylococcaceae bacterium]
MSRFSACELNRNSPKNGLAVFFLLFNVPLVSLAQPQEAQVLTMQSSHYLDRIEGSLGYGKNINWQCMPEIFNAQALISS